MAGLLKRGKIYHATYRLGGRERRKSLETDSYRVFRYADQIEVLFGCLGSGPMEGKREALLVELDFVPRALYVTRTIAK